jgi:hypothetical protein
MILLRLISWPYARKHLSALLLTTAGIVLGVAVFVGMHTANQVCSRRFINHRSHRRLNAAPNFGGRTGVR